MTPLARLEMNLIAYHADLMSLVAPFVYVECIQLG